MPNHEQQLEIAEKAVAEQKEEISQHKWRLHYHVMPLAGWMNDPNGFSYFNGEYHLFYQHHPFHPKWGPMYWGHVKSKDLVQWEHMPIALAPSEEYDKDGCFSGSAIEKDGKLYVIYTGNVWIDGPADEDLHQVQAMAVSKDGVHFEKLAENPIISEVPIGDINTFHFRDPKVWKHDSFYYMVLGSKTKSNVGQVLLYRSEDLFNWEFISVMAKGKGNFGYMWECPDLFELDGKDVLMMSPQGVQSEGIKFHNLHQSGYVIGNLDYHTGQLEHGPLSLLDYGFDFYAPQTMQDSDGRRILIAWMDMWESAMPTQESGYAGAMTLPRVVELKGNRLFTKPIPELRKLRQNEVRYEHVWIEGETSFTEVEGDCVELELLIDAKSTLHFGMKLRVDEVTGQQTLLTIDRQTNLITLDRNQSGKGPGGSRQAKLVQTDLLHLQIFIDKSSVEVFINYGEIAMSARIFPDEQAKGLSIFTEQPLLLKHLNKWDIRKAVQ